MPDRDFPPVKITEMITHDELIERCPWLTAQIVNKWRRTGAIRFFGGKNGMIVSAISDIERAITETLNASLEIYRGPPRSPSASRDHASAVSREMSEADKIREEMWLRELNERKFPAHKSPSHKPSK